MAKAIREVRFFEEPETGTPHVLDHGVSPAEAEEVVRAPVEDLPAKGGARMAMGSTRDGRLLRVIYVHDREDPS